MALLEEFGSERDVFRREAPTFATQVRTQPVGRFGLVGVAESFENLIGLLLIEALHRIELLPLFEGRNSRGRLRRGILSGALWSCGYMQLVSTRRGLGRCGCRLIFRRYFRLSCTYMQLGTTRRRARQGSTAGQSGLSSCVYMQLLIGNLMILRWWSCRYMQPSVLFALNGTRLRPGGAPAGPSGRRPPRHF